MCFASILAFLTLSKGVSTVFERRIFALSLVSALAICGCADAPQEEEPNTCDNMVIDAGEDCDGTLFADGKGVCPAGTTGVVTCGSDCKVVTSACIPVPAVCNNGTLEFDEDCDGTLFAAGKGECPAGTTGSVTCSSDCKVVTSACVAGATCNNGLLEAGEDCDGTQFAVGKDVCPAGTTGSVTCGSDCKVVTSACVAGATCNNGVLEAGEKCDGSQFADGVKVCPEGTTGDVSKIYCNDKCEVVTSSACHGENPGPVCGDGAVNAAGENCENTAYGVVNAGGAVITCENIEGSGAQGTLRCADCNIDSSDCKAADVGTGCGNGELDAGEDCDNKVFSEDAAVLCGLNNTAKDKSEWVCTKGCRLDINQSCVPVEVVSKCGNLKLDEGEGCDVVGGKVVTDAVCPEGQELKGDAFVCTNDCTVDLKASCKAVNACPEDELKCDDNTLQICMDGIWQDYVTCPAETVCDVSSEHTDFCVPNTTCTGNVSSCVDTWHYKCIDGGGWLHEDCSARGQVCVEGTGCVEPPPCGNGRQDANEQCETIDGVFVPWEYTAQQYGCNYYNEKYPGEGYTLYKSGAPTCTDECKISVQSCVKLTDADFSPVKSWSFSSFDQITSLTKSGEVTIHNVGNKGFKTSKYASGWEIGNTWPNSLNWDAYMWFKVGVIDTNAVSIIFNAKRGSNGPKKLKVKAYSNGTNETNVVGESQEISLTTDWATYSVQMKNKSTIGPDFSFKVSAYNGDGSMFIQNVQVKKADAL